MPALQLNPSRTSHGLRAITLENELLRVQILPEAGAKIWQIVYLPLDTPLLWNNPDIAPAAHPLHACYDDVWSGGWDELFPNDEEALIAGQRYPDHGEFWTARWDAEPFTSAHEVGVALHLRTPLSAITVEKTITLRRNEAQLRFSHRLKNHTGAPFPFLWKLHPAMRVTTSHRIDMPAMQGVREPAFPGTLAEAPIEFTWPHITRAGKPVDLRRVPHPDEQELYFFYGTELQDGWCAITDTAQRFACGLRFDPEIFCSCWLFATYGGWRGYNVAVLEPCTGYPIQFSEMQAAGHARVLPPGETLATEVLFCVQEGLESVGAIGKDGRMIAAASDGWRS